MDKIMTAAACNAALRAAGYAPVYSRASGMRRGCNVRATNAPNAAEVHRVKLRSGERGLLIEVGGGASLADVIAVLRAAGATVDAAARTVSE